MTVHSVDDIKLYFIERSTEVTGRLVELMQQAERSPTQILELERLKSKSFEYDRFVRFRTGTDFMDESNYYKSLKEDHGI